MAKLIGLVAVYVMLKCAQATVWTADKVKQGSTATVNYLQTKQQHVSITIDKANNTLEERIKLLKEEKANKQ